MPEQRRLAEAVAASDLPRKPRVLVGGAPTSPAWAASFGATHAENALRAVAAAEALPAVTLRRSPGARSPSCCSTAAWARC